MPPVSPQRRPALEPPRFRLRTLLVVVTVCCILLAVLISVGPYGKFATIMLTLTILAHFIGSTIGHRLRDLGDQPAPDEPNRSAAERYPVVEASQFAPTTRLSGHRAPGRLILLMTIGWAVLGGAGGAALLFILNGDRANVVNVASGAAAFAVLGGIWGFALASFLQELWSALAEAQGGGKSEIRMSKSETKPKA